MISLHRIFVAIVHLQLEAACGQYAEPNRKSIRSVFSATLVHAGPGAGFFIFLIPFCWPLYYALPYDSSNSLLEGFASGTCGRLFVFRGQNMPRARGLL